MQNNKVSACVGAVRKTHTQTQKKNIFLKDMKKKKQSNKDNY